MGKYSGPAHNSTCRCASKHKFSTFPFAPKITFARSTHEQTFWPRFAAFIRVPAHKQPHTVVCLQLVGRVKQIVQIKTVKVYILLYIYIYIYIDKQQSAGGVHTRESGASASISNAEVREMEVVTFLGFRKSRVARSQR